MPKWFDDEYDDDRPSRGHRTRNRQRKRWDDADPAPAYVPSPALRRDDRPRPAVTAPVTSANVETGTVRFFEATKGFGFVAPAQGADLFVHITAVRRAGLETLTQGQVIRFERGPGRQPGKEAVLRILPD